MSLDTREEVLQATQPSPFTDSHGTKETRGGDYLLTPLCHLPTHLKQDCVRLGQPRQGSACVEMERQLPPSRRRRQGKAGSLAGAAPMRGRPASTYSCSRRAIARLIACDYGLMVVGVLLRDRELWCEVQPRVRGMGRQHPVRFART